MQQFTDSKKTFKVWKKKNEVSHQGLLETCAVGQNTVNYRHQLYGYLTLDISRSPVCKIVCVNNQEV